MTFVVRILNMAMIMARRLKKAKYIPNKWLESAAGHTSGTGC